ncbi:ABC transporter substrate-binding protein, partial [bacterium]
MRSGFACAAGATWLRVSDRTMSGKARKFFIVFLFLLAGCARQGAPRDFTVAIESYPANLDPRYPNDAYSSKLQQLIFNGLLKFDEEMRLVPDLVEGYEYRSDTRLRLKLRAGVRFHDGHELSAKDVLYTFKSLMDPKKRSPLYDTFRRITEIDAVDDLTLEIELEEPFAPFLTALTVGIIPHGADEASPLPFAQRPVGTGPFQWVGARTDQWIRLKAFPDYFEGAPSIGGLQFKTIRDDTTRVLQLLRGEVDLVQNAVPLVMAEWLRRKTDLVMASDTGINYAYLAFNLRDPALQDRRVREAVALAIDRDKLIEHRLKGFAKKATGILAPSNWSYEKNVSQYDHNPERAKA